MVFRQQRVPTAQGKQREAQEIPDDGDQVAPIPQMGGLAGRSQKQGHGFLGQYQTIAKGPATSTRGTRRTWKTVIATKLMAASNRATRSWR